MKKLFYPAVFHIAEEGGYWVTFPDFPECLTQGENMQEAYDMAIDALGLILTDDINDHKELPEPSNITHVDDGVVVIIPYDYLEYNRKYHNKSIKKTLTIPEWLNNEALRLNLNFIDSKCDVGASKNAAEHFLRSEIFTCAIYKVAGVRLFLI